MFFISILISSKIFFKFSSLNLLFVNSCSGCFSLKKNIFYGKKKLDSFDSVYCGMTKRKLNKGENMYRYNQELINKINDLKRHCKGPIAKKMLQSFFPNYPIQTSINNFKPMLSKKVLQVMQYVLRRIDDKSQWGRLVYYVKDKEGMTSHVFQDPIVGIEYFLIYLMITKHKKLYESYRKSMIAIGTKEVGGYLPALTVEEVTTHLNKEKDKILNMDFSKSFFRKEK